MDEYDSARSCDLYLIVLVAAGFDFWLHPEVAAAKTKASSGWDGLGPGEKEWGGLGSVGSVSLVRIANRGYLTFGGTA